jgi:Cu/Ag efflux pump CusA
MGVVRFALRWPYTFYVLALLILFLGVTAFRSMPADIFPEIDIPVVTVIWQETGLSTPEMEQRVTTYSEYSISSNVNGIKDIEAQTLTASRFRRSIFSRTSISIWRSRRSSRPQTRSALCCRPASNRRS